MDKKNAIIFYRNFKKDIKMLLFLLFEKYQFSDMSNHFLKLKWAFFLISIAWLTLPSLAILT